MIINVLGLDHVRYISTANSSSCCLRVCHEYNGELFRE